MRLLSLSVWDQNIAVGVPDSPKKNWFTIITGPNGSRKSLLLRLISSAAQGYGTSKIGDHPSIPVKFNGGSGEKPSHVIAIAGTAFDRFQWRTPQAPARRRPSERQRASYAYFGLKAANGVMSAVHSMRLIGMALLRKRDVLTQRAASLVTVLTFLELSPHVTVRLRRASRLNSVAKNIVEKKPSRGEFDPTTLRGALKEALSKGTDAGDPDVAEFVETVMADRSRRERLKNTLAKFPIDIDFDLSAGTYVTSADIDDFDLEIMIRAGLVNISDLRFSTPGETEHEFSDLLHLSAGDLSSGQWQILLSMFGVALEATKDALIIIDEPENSLHPEWQREYLPLLEHVLAPFEGCHVVIATHAPLIVSGIKNKKGNILQLVADDRSRLGIGVKDLEPTYGWDARKVLETLFGMGTTRAVQFVAASDQALSMVKDGATDGARFRKLVNEINETADLLPNDDPMRMIVRALNRVASNPVVQND